MVNVPAFVIGDPVTVKMVGMDKPTLVTVPPPAGVDHVPSPLQKVVALALVPLFKLVTGKFPVTLVVRSIDPANIALVTFDTPIVVGKEPVPLPVTSPVNVMV